MPYRLISKNVKVCGRILESLGGHGINTFPKPVLIGSSRRLKVDGVRIG
jgi:hypothetical protein